MHPFASLAATAAVVALAVPPDTATAGARGPKRSEVIEIIVHATGGPFCRKGEVAYSPAGAVDAMKRFFERSGGVSIHYIVGRDGEVVRSVPEDEVAHHAIDHNDKSIGIELINAGDGKDPYPEPQIHALAKLIKGIRERWRLPLAAVKGHEDVDKSTFPCGGRQARRKQDPGPQFPWSTFRRDLARLE